MLATVTNFFERRVEIPDPNEFLELLNKRNKLRQPAVNLEQRQKEVVDLLTAVCTDDATIEAKIMDTMVANNQIELAAIAEGTYDLINNGHSVVRDDKTTMYERKIYSNGIIVINGITKSQLTIDIYASTYHGNPVQACSVVDEATGVDVIVCEMYHNNGTIVIKVINNNDTDVSNFMESYIPAYYSPLTLAIPSIMTEINRKVPTEQKVNNQISDIPIQDKMDLGEDDDMPKSNGKKK